MHCLRPQASIASKYRACERVLPARGQIVSPLSDPARRGLPRSAAAVIAFSFLGIAVHAQNGRELPTPFDTPRSVTVAPNTPGELPNPSYARSISERTIGRIHEIARTIEADKKKIAELNASLSQARSNVDALIAEKARALSELRSGLYCSKCLRTKTEIEQEDHENFYTHIQRVNGKIIAASQQEIDKKAAEFDRKIADAQLRADQLATRSAKEIPALQWEIEGGYDQLQQGLYLWQAAATLEADLLKIQEQAREQAERRTLAEAQMHQDEIRNRLSQLGATAQDQDAAKGQRTLLQSWKNIYQQAEDRGQWEYKAFLTRAQQAEEQRARDFADLSSTLVPVTNGFVPRFGSFLPSLSVPVGDVSLSSSPDRLGVRFSFFKIPIPSAGLPPLFSGGLDARNSAKDTEVIAFVALCGSIKLGVGWKTQYGEYGVQSGPSFQLDLDPPKPKPTTILPKP